MSIVRSFEKMQCSRKVFVDHQTICLMILTGSSNILKKIHQTFLFKYLWKVFQMTRQSIWWSWTNHQTFCRMIWINRQYLMGQWLFVNTEWRRDTDVVHFIMKHYSCMLFPLNVCGARWYLLNNIQLYMGLLNWTCLVCFNMPVWYVCAPHCVYIAMWLQLLSLFRGIIQMAWMGITFNFCASNH